MMKPILLSALIALSAGSSSLFATPADIHLSIEVPQIATAEYHRPYVAAWIENPDGTALASLSVWYDTEMPNAGGDEWLKDLRQWWRKTGRSSKETLHAVSSPTKPVGVHEIKQRNIEIPALEKGEYTLVVEAAREVGGRELVKIPFRWDGKVPANGSATGKQEIGTVQFSATISQ